MPRPHCHNVAAMKALVLENIHPTAVDILRSRGYEVELRTGALREDELIESLGGVSCSAFGPTRR